jgi:integrase
MHVSMVRSIYEYARATNAYEGRNPADRNSGSQKLRQQPHVRDPKALGRFAQAKLWEAFDEQERPLLAVLLLCGLRFQEASALQWCDFASDHLLVRRFRKADGQLSDVGKSSHASRSIRLSNQVIDILSQHTHYQKARGISVADAALMFPNSKGKIRDVTSFSRGVLARACRQAYIDRITPHQLRHTFVQNQINAGTNVVLLSKLLGHHDPSFTLKVYTNILSFGDPPISEIALDASDARRAAHARNKKRSA